MPITASDDDDDNDVDDGENRFCILNNNQNKERWNVQKNKISFHLRYLTHLNIVTKWSIYVMSPDYRLIGLIKSVCCFREEQLKDNQVKRDCWLVFFFLSGIFYLIDMIHPGHIFFAPCVVNQL